MSQRKNIPENSIDMAASIVKKMKRPGLSVPKKIRLFCAFELTLRTDLSLAALTHLCAAWRLVNDYLAALDADTQSNSSAMEKNTKRMKLRANLGTELKKCGKIGQCLNNGRVIGGKHPKKNNFDEIDRELINNIFTLGEIIKIEKLNTPAVDKEQLSMIITLINRKEYELARQLSQSSKMSDQLLQQISKVLPSPSVNINTFTPTTMANTTITPTPFSDMQTMTQTPPQHVGMKKAFNVFFLGTGEILPEDAKASSKKKYKHTLLTQFQKAIPDSVLIAGIAAGYGDYAKTEDGKIEIKATHGKLGTATKELIGGEGYEASISAASVDLEKFFNLNNINPNNSDLEINLIGFSRGAVTAIRFANRLRFIYPMLKVNIFALDPVAGPSTLLADDWEARNIPSNVGEYHVIHMQHVGGKGNMQYSVGFEPQDFNCLTVERPDNLVFSVDILPGLHGGAQIVSGDGMQDPAQLTGYYLHDFLKRHGATMPHQSIKLANIDRISFDDFDYLTICASPLERLKKFETMIANEDLYGQYGSKIRKLNNEMHRYHQNSDYFITQQHREDFKAVYPNIFYWFFEGGVKDTAEINNRRSSVRQEIQQLDKKSHTRLINYMIKAGSEIDDHTTSIPKQPVGNENFPIEKKSNTNHQTLSQNPWIYYHPENKKLRQNIQISNGEIAHHMQKLQVKLIIENLESQVSKYTNPKKTAVTAIPDTEGEVAQRAHVAKVFLINLQELKGKLSNISKQESIELLFLLLRNTIAEEYKIYNREGDHPLADILWSLIEGYGLQSILDKIVKDNIEQVTDLIKPETAPQMSTSAASTSSTSSTSTMLGVLQYNNTGNDSVSFTDNNELENEKSLLASNHEFIGFVSPNLQHVTTPDTSNTTIMATEQDPIELLSSPENSM